MDDRYHFREAEMILAEAEHLMEMDTEPIPRTELLLAALAHAVLALAKRPA